jgi:hypothetical protein
MLVPRIRQENGEEVQGVAERDSKGRFVKGNTASPGRPKLPDEFKTRAKTYADEALDRLAEIMRDTTAKHSDVIRACELLLERGYGKVTPAEERREDDGYGTGVVMIPQVLTEEGADG